MKKVRDIQLVLEATLEDGTVVRGVSHSFPYHIVEMLDAEFLATLEQGCQKEEEKEDLDFLYLKNLIRALKVSKNGLGKDNKDQFDVCAESLFRIIKSYK